MKKIQLVMLLAVTAMMPQLVNAQQVEVWINGHASIFNNPDSVVYAETQQNQIAEDDSSHTYVDLGLSVKWASTNIGAEKPEDYGNYYAWGETETKESYSKENHLYYIPAHEDADGFTIEASYEDIGKDISGTQFDVAHVKWGSNWRMPTQTEWQELYDKCTWTWTAKGGVNGYKVTSKTNNNWIFLPAAGCRSSSGLYGAGSNGYYWSSSLYPYGSYNAYYMYFSSSYRNANNYYSRYDGHSVRAVRSE